MNKCKCLKMSWERYIIAEPGRPPCSACVLWSVLLTAQVWVYYSSYLKGEENLLHIFPKMCDHSKALQINPYETSYMKDVITKASCMTFNIIVHLFWSIFFLLLVLQECKSCYINCGPFCPFLLEKEREKGTQVWNLNLSSTWTRKLTKEKLNLYSVFLSYFRSLHKFVIRTWAYDSVSTLWELQPEGIREGEVTVGRFLYPGCHWIQRTGRSLWTVFEEVSLQ